MKNILCFFMFLMLGACGSSEGDTTPAGEIPFVIKGVDASLIPEVRESGIITKSRQGQPEDMLATFKNEGVNTIRLRLWHTPADGHSGLTEVKAFAHEIKNKGMKVWLTVHYSDTWADPAHQAKPVAWQGQGYEQLKQSVYSYTKTIVEQVQPDYIQIGNEINAGFLWPEGSYNNLQQFRELLAEGIRAVRENSPGTKIMLHYAGHDWAHNFYNSLSGLEYDIIALSYYPIWHGKDLAALQSAIATLGAQYSKQVVIAETAYPFTLGWNDFTNNIVGSNEQIIPQYPATPQGQKEYLARIRNIAAQQPYGGGFCYWGGEWISYNGPQATNGSAVENTALWDFDAVALPVMENFN